MAVVKGASRVKHKKFKFVVQIDGFGSAEFQKCSKLEAIINIIETKEGGALVPDKDLGTGKFSDITLTRGATSDLDMFNWFKSALDAAANSGLTADKVKRTADIIQQDRDGTELRRWRCYEGLPAGFVPGEWDNDADENTMEEVTIAMKYFDLVPVQK